MSEREPDNHEPEKPAEQKELIPLTAEQEAAASRKVRVDYRGNLHYENTLIEQLAQRDVDTVMMGLHVTICKQIVDEYNRQGYLSKNSHRRLTQVIYMYTADITVQLSLDVEAAVDEASILDRYAEKISKAFRASRIEGNVETVTEFPPSIEARRSLLRKQS